MALTQTTVAGNDLGIKIAGKVLENLYASNFTPVGYVVNADYQGFSTDTFTVGITRINRPGGTVRTIGGDVNGGFFNTNEVKTPTNSTMAMFMDRLYDQVFDIPYSLEDSVPYSYVENIASGIASEVGEQMGADTLTEMYNSVKGRDANIVKFGGEDYKDIFPALTKANEILSEGDITTGDRAFPAANRSMVATPEVFTQLLNSEKFILTGSDKAFSTLESAYQGVNYESFKGVIAGLAAFQAPSSLMPKATKGKVLAFVDHPSAITRAYYDRGVRAIPSPVGQGTRLQPYYRWGVKAVRPAGIVGIVSSDWAQS
jgi:hypothetical protein